MTPHSHCFLTPPQPRHWHWSRIVNRIFLLYGAGLIVIIFNTWTIRLLRGQSYRWALSTRRLQVRLILVTIIFIFLWVLLEIPYYIYESNFATELAFRVSETNR